MGLGDVVGGLVGRGSDDEQPDDPEEGLGGEFGDEDDFDDLGGWEDEDDDLDGLGGEDAGGGGAAADLEPRLDELESEMERISSTMGTVRSENESITETVDDIEDNVRKLLEIYEMVTRGVNPFVDEAEEGDAMGEGFGLFDGAGGGGADADTDPDVDDADSFFDDDWDEGEPIEEEFDDDPLETEAAAAETDPAGDEDGKTFDELKSEYQEGDEDWEDDGVDGADADEDTGAPDAVSPPTAGAGSEASDQEEPVGEDGKPYLTELPGGYGADLIVMEWLSFLRSASNTPEALRAIRYYETIGWVGPHAAESLAQYLSGLGPGTPGPTADGSTQLTIDHHTRSLGYIGKLGGTEIQTERLQWSDSTAGQVHEEGGTHRGIQR